MDIISSIAAFGYTVVIGIVLLIVWENIRRKQYGVFRIYSGLVVVYRCVIWSSTFMDIFACQVTRLGVVE